MGNDDANQLGIKQLAKNSSIDDENQSDETQKPPFFIYHQRHHYI